MLYLIIIASCCTSLGVKKKQIIVGQWNCWNWCLELLWRSVCLTEPLFKCCISFLHVAPDAKNCLSFCNELLTRFWEPFNTCFSNFTEVCTNPNIHFPPCTNQCCWPVLVFYREPELLRFCHFQYLSRTIWFGLGLFNIFQNAKPINFRAGLNFLDQQFQVQWFFDPYNNLHFWVSGSSVSAFE